jgi:putative transcriptional regulator
MRRLFRFFAVTVLMLLAVVARAQAPEPGQLLVASAALSDPNYSRTVLLLVHHAQDGSIAVALNRPTWVSPGEAFPEIPGVGDFGDELFFGGPIAPGQLLIVFQSDRAFVDNVRQVLDDVYVAADPTVLQSLDSEAEGAPHVRLYAGHAAWNPGQLEAEIAAGNWRLLPAQTSWVFDASPDDLWERLPLGTDGVTASLR